MANPDSYHLVEFTLPSAGTAAVGPEGVPFAGEVVDVRATADANVASATVNVKQNGVSIGVLSFSGGKVSNVLTVTPGVNNGTNYGAYNGLTVQSTATGFGVTTNNQPPSTTPVATVAAGDLFTATPSAAPGANVAVSLTVRKA